MATEYDLSHITSIEDLKKEQALITQRILMREEELRLKLYEIPAEIAAAGVNSLIPNFFRGKITDAALNGGKKLMKKLLAPSSDNRINSISNFKQTNSVISIIGKGLKLLKGKR
jgi:hypothetical protein